MKNWIDMKYSEIIQMEDKNLRRQYKCNWDKIWINIINPLYNALSDEKREEFTSFQSDNKTIFELAAMLKELSGGHEKTKQIVFSRIKK